MFSDEPTASRSETPDIRAGLPEREPPPRVLRMALRRIQTRRNDAATINELLHAFSSLMRGLATLFGSDKYSSGGRHD